jgi:predicted small metal-binding protein
MATAGTGGGMKTTLDCPCGTRVVGKDEDELVEKTQAHLREKHPDLDYGRDEILFIAF